MVPDAKNPCPVAIFIVLFSCEICWSSPSSSPLYLHTSTSSTHCHRESQTVLQHLYHSLSRVHLLILLQRNADLFSSFCSKAASGSQNLSVILLQISPCPASVQKPLLQISFQFLFYVTETPLVRTLYNRIYITMRAMIPKTSDESNFLEQLNIPFWLFWTR